MALEHFMQEQLWLESGDFQKVWICGYEIFGEIIKRKWISTKPVGKMNLCAESWYLLNSDTKVKPNPNLKSKLNFINSACRYIKSWQNNTSQMQKKEHGV